MITLNLQAESPEFQALKEYLEENVSEILADKINNGVKIEKDGKTLINKKTLETFMDYAHGQAKNLAAKNARYACITHEVVFSWAIHYFEEDSIEGTLFNLDGTPYKKPVAKTSSKPIATPTPKKTQSNQVSLFDSLLSDEPKIEEKKPEKFVSVNPIYKQYFDAKEQHPDHVIVTRLGDFYEAFGDDAKLLADLCNLTLTSRLFQGKEDRIPMIGFPQHCAEIYFNKIKTKYKLAIVENNEIKLHDAEVQEDDDFEEDIEDLTLEEMQSFDGDIDEDFGEISKSDKDILLEELYMLFDDNILFGGI